jgi:uncharacterized membrane protein YqjE
MDDRTRTDRIGEPVVTSTGEAHGTAGETSRSATSLITDALTHMSSLVRKEVDLARAEISENMNRAMVAIGLLVGAVVFALVALIVLAGALTAAIAELGIEEGWAALIVAVLFAIVAAIMATKGRNDLKASSLAPTRTAENLRRDKDAVKESL